jgi:hypothetical protein
MPSAGATGERAWFLGLGRVTLRFQRERLVGVRPVGQPDRLGHSATLLVECCDDVSGVPYPVVGSIRFGARE